MSGVPLVRSEAGKLTRFEILRLTPITILLMSTFLIIVFRDIRYLLIPMSIAGAASLICLGVMAVANVPISFSTAVLPSIILALACAYSMHFMNASLESRAKASLIVSLAGVAAPVLMSGTTTALGFLAMSMSSVDLISHLGTYGALGAVLVTLATVTLSPAILGMMKNRKRDKHILGKKAVESISSEIYALCCTKRYKIVGWWAFVSLCSIGGLVQIRVASDVIEWFPKSGQLRSSYEQIRSSLSGITPLNILVFSDAGERVTKVETIQAIGDFSSALQQHPLVGKSLSVADPIELIHENMIGDELRNDLPLSESHIEQYLLLLEEFEQLDDVITNDRLYANIVIRLDSNSSDDIATVGEWARSWWNRNGPDATSIAVTGIMYEFARAQDNIALAGIFGMLFAIAAIGAVILVFFRNLNVLFVTLMANVIPVSVILGIIGWLGVPLDAGTVCVASLSLGIAVDDSIHIVSEFDKNRSCGRSADVSLQSALSAVLPALFATTLAIGLGFAVLAFSEIALIRNLGATMVAAVVVCLVADSTLLVALLHKIRT